MYVIVLGIRAKVLSQCFQRRKGLVVILDAFVRRFYLKDSSSDLKVRKESI
jgi:hypothetical protein